MPSEPLLGVGALYRLRGRDDLPRDVRAALVRAYHAQTTVRVLAANVLSALLMVALLWQHGPRHWLAVWAVCMVGLTVVSATINVAYSADRDADLFPDRWMIAFVLVAFAGGSAWGAGGWMFLDPGQPDAMMIIVVALACVAAGAAASKTAVLGAGVAFFLPVLAPLFVAFIGAGGGANWPLAVIVFVYFWSLTAFSAASNRVMLKSVRLARRNEQLAERAERSDQYLRALLETMRDRLAGGGEPFQALVVDDSEVSRLVVTEMLAASGAVVDVARDGAEAVAKVEGKPYDIVFMDLHMPVMNGFEATRAIRTLEARNDRPRCTVIALSALEDDRGAAIEAGCDECAVKPLGRAALLGILNLYVEAGRRADAAAVPRAAGRSGSMRHTFLDTLGQELQALRGAAAAADRDLVASFAHRAKGNAMLFGAHDLVDILRQLEAAAHRAPVAASGGAEDEATLEDYVTAAEAELDRLRRRLAERPEQVRDAQPAQWVRDEQS